MSWRDDVSPAAAGDSAARERVREFLTPFLHGVALAHAPHHVVRRLMPRLLDMLGAALAAAEPSTLAAVAVATARRIAQEAGHAGLEERPHEDAAMRDARQVLASLRAVPDGPREALVLRVVEGIPGPELAEVLGTSTGELRAELEQGAAAAARALGAAQDFAGDAYLWELLGAPPPFLARLEMALPVLRYDPLAPAEAESHTAGTMQDLAPVGGPLSAAPSAARGLVFDEQDETNVGAPQVTGGPNPFEPAVRTIAATDLPAEARGQLPEPAAPQQSSASALLRSTRVPPRGDGSAASGNESSGRSGRSGPSGAIPSGSNPGTKGPRVLQRGEGGESSSKSGRMAPLGPRGDGSAASGGETSSKSGRMAPLPPREEGSPLALGTAAAPDPTRMQVPALVLKRQEEIATNPEGHEGILNSPTMTMAAAIAQGETRINIMPVSPRAEGADVGGAPGEPRLLSAQLLQGSSPWFVALALLIGGLLANWAGVFTIEKQARVNWNLVQVVVAAEEMSAGTLVTMDNVAIRGVPAMGEKSDVVHADALNFVLEQKLAVDVQLGDPLFYSQFVANRGNQRLSQRVAKQMRGYTIPTSVLGSVAHHVKPGDLVDVVATFQMQGQQVKKGRGASRAVTILQSVNVLATGRIADFTPGAAVDENEKPYSNVTLLLTAEEAEVVTLARIVGPLTLTLRNEDDKAEFAQREYTDIDTLLDGNRRRLSNQRQRDLVDQVKAIRSTPSPK